MRVYAYYADRSPMEGREGEITADFVPIDPSHIEAMLQASEPVAHPRTTEARAPGEANRAPLFVRIPEGGASQEIVQTIVRMVSPNATSSQDGLRALFASPQFQQFFQGAKLTQGATQLLPNNQLLAILLPPNALTLNPEAAKSFLIAQGLPSQLIQNIPDRALAGALNALLAASQGQDPAHFLHSVFSLFALAGASGEQIQAAFESMLGQAQGLSHSEHLTPEAMQQLASRLFATNNPQILGLNQMVQQSFGQGVNQVLNSFIRVFLGGALMQSQSAWPQVVPNDRMLAELGGLFASQRQQQEQRDKEGKMARSRGLDQLLIEGDLHDRVERKSSLGGDSSGQGDAYSLLLETEEEPGPEDEEKP
jgi:hypothetical protein